MKWNYKNKITNISKSANCVSFIKNLAFNLNIKLDIDVDDFGWIFKKQNIWFSVTDESKENIEVLIDTLELAMEEYFLQ